jgi:hypothetical protein
MLKSSTLIKSLTAFVPVGESESKTANAFTNVDAPVDNQTLQEIVGDPDTQPLSWSAQTVRAEGDSLKADDGDPLGGDEVFFSGLFDGARFMAKNGTYWDVESYDWEGVVTIRNVWYPRIQAVISIQKLRDTIHSWTEPFLQRIPPPPPGADYGTIMTKTVK